MPIYAYKCNACGFAKDVLQKMSDSVLTACPECGQETFSKQLTAAGFQLKGSGWYATDFKGGSSASTPVPASTSTSDSSVSAPEAATSKTEAASPSPGGCGTGCACHS